MRLIAKSSLVCIVSGFLLVVGFSGNGVAAAPTARTVTLTGTYELITADTLPAAHVGSKDVVQENLVVGSTAYKLHWSHGRHHLRGHGRITATGTVNGHDLTVSSVSAATPLPLPATTGTTHVLVILADWTTPDSVTQASAAQSLFTDTNNWYRSTSNGLVGQSGAVTPWLHIAAPANNACYGNGYTIMSDAQSAALSAGYDASTYDRTVVYFPNDSSAGSDCASYAGWAEEPGDKVWLNGYLDLRTTTHEQGHNYGLSHAHSDLCSTGALTGTCSFTEYGDDYDAMGSSGFVAEFSAKQKSQLGWMSATTLSPGGSTTLVPYETASGTRSAVINVSSTRAYWLEYRQPTGVDSVLPIGATNGVLVHLVDPSVAPADQDYGAIGPTLIDESPGDGTSVGNIGDVTLKSGQQWTTPEGLTITVGAVTRAGAAVSVSSTSAGQPDLVVTSLTWSPPTPLTGNAVTFSATVRNQGTAATPAGIKLRVAFSIDGTEVNWSDTDTAALAPGASTTLTANSGPSGASTWAATGGSHTLQASVDNPNLIAESDETNNTLNRSLTVGAPMPGAFGVVSPSRLLDTRNGTGAPAAAVAGHQSVQLTVLGVGGVPASGVSAVVLNVTETGATSTGYITAYADGSTRPTASNLNFVTGQTVPNLVIAAVGDNGKVDFYNGSSTPVNLIADVSGYYIAGAPTAPGAFGVSSTADLHDR